MTMPEIPPQQYRPDLYNTIIDLLDSIALEEMALSHLLNAEAEKIQHFIGYISSCTPPDVLIDFNVVVNETLETVIMKEWLLLRKLEKVTRFFHQQFPPPIPPRPPVPPCPPTPPRPPVPPCPPPPPCPARPCLPIYQCRPRSTCKISCKPRRPVKKHRFHYEE
jgi:hypothetical protein